MKELRIIMLLNIVLFFASLIIFIISVLTRIIKWDELKFCSIIACVIYCIVTGNLDCWVEKLCKRVGCQYYTSKADVKKNEVEKLTHILKKESVVKDFRRNGKTVVFIGEGNNDLEAMRQADISIASGLTHKPANSVLGIVDYVIYDEETLCRQLNQLL